MKPVRAQTVINVPFELHIRAHPENQNVDVYSVDVPDVRTVTGGSMARARKILKQRLERWVKRAIREFDSDNRRRWVIGTKEGRVLIVQHFTFSWGYYICGAGCRFGSSTTGLDSYDEAVDVARCHAAQSYGGIHWEHGII